MAEILRVTFGAKDLRESLEEIRLFLNLSSGPDTVEQIAEFKKFRLFEDLSPYKRLIKLAQAYPVEQWAAIGTENDLPSMVEKKNGKPVDEKQAGDAEMRASMLKIVKRWTMTKLWQEHPPEQSFSIRFEDDEVINKAQVPRRVKTPRAEKKEQPI